MVPAASGSLLIGIQSGVRVRLEVEAVIFRLHLTPVNVLGRLGQLTYEGTLILLVQAFVLLTGNVIFHLAAETVGLHTFHDVSDG